MKKLIVAGVATAMMSGAASAYEYQNIDNNNEHAVNTLNRMAFTIANEMEFPESDLNAFDLLQEKHALAACTIDNIGKDINQIGGTGSQLMELVHTATRFWRMGEDRFFHMDQSNVDYIETINYKCREYHPQPKDAIIDYAGIDARKEIKKVCEAGTPSAPKCRLNVYEKYETFYLNKHGY